MASYQIPLSAKPQTFTIQLGATEYQLRLSYQNVPEGGWQIDISDPTTGNPLIAGIPLVTGADLLAQYAYLNLPGQLWVATDGDPDAVPTFDNLGSTSHLYFVVP